jgi:hypothetical protein
MVKKSAILRPNAAGAIKKVVGDPLPLSAAFCTNPPSATLINSTCSERSNN